MDQFSAEADEGFENEKSHNHRGMLLISLLVAGFAILYFYRDVLSLEQLAQYEFTLRQWYVENPMLMYAFAFLLYVIVAGLSIPSGPSLLTVAFGWFFGVIPGVILVSLGSTVGACVAFLLSRFLFRHAVESRFGDRLLKFNESLQREGPFYLFFLRLFPVIPYVVLNVLMGLTPMRLRTFWWISQIGMLPASTVYVYAGACVPNVTKLSEEGLESVFTTEQVTRITLALLLLGMFPFVVRFAVRKLRKRMEEPA